MFINSIKKIIFPIFLLLISFIIANKTLASSLPYQMRGSFLIQVEDKGQAFYVDTNNGIKYKLDKNNTTWKTISDLSLGVSRDNLSQIPIAINKELIILDSDSDGLDDSLERAIGTNPFLSDSDNDSYNDLLEVLNHYDPLSKGRLPINEKLSKKLAGKLLLDTQGNGELWYVNPSDNLRYYISNYNELFKVIKIVGKGISNDNLKLIADSSLIKDKKNKSIKVDTSKKQKLYYFLDDVEIGSFSISSGSYSMATPKGSYKIINKHPLAWSSYGLWMPYWMGLGTGKFGFHELPIWPSGYREGESHLGIPVSHGCIRLGVGPAEFLYNWADVGTPVEIY